MSHDSRQVAQELDGLKKRVVTMAEAAEERLRTVMHALIERDHPLLAAVIAGDARIDSLQIEIDDSCFKLLALHQPVAVDLRTVVSSLKVNADLERVGDLAVNIAEAGQRYLAHPPVKPLIDLPRMGGLALKMLREAVDAFTASDVNLAKSVLRQDDWLDGLRDQILRELVTYMLGNQQLIEPAVDLILISRHLERVGDHATNIAEDVIFIVEARDVRHRSSGIPAIERRRSGGAAPV